MIIKICGITDVSTARHLSSLGADMMGLVFVPTSPRCISLSQALAMREAGEVRIVAVFQNHPLETLQQIVKVLRPDYVQLHGEEDSDYCSLISVPIIKVVRLERTAQLTECIFKSYKNTCHYFLIDRHTQGKGALVDLNQVSELSKQYPLLLSGGLTPSNISAVLASAGEAIVGVDVSSGVESSPGHKDLRKIRTFINLVRRKYV